MIRYILSKMMSIEEGRTLSRPIYLNVESLYDAMTIARDMADNELAVFQLSEWEDEGKMLVSKWNVFPKGKVIRVSRQISRAEEEPVTDKRSFYISVWTSSEAKARKAVILKRVANAFHGTIMADYEAMKELSYAMIKLGEALNKRYGGKDVVILHDKEQTSFYAKFRDAEELIFAIDYDATKGIFSRYSVQDKVNEILEERDSSVLSLSRDEVKTKNCVESDNNK